MKWIMKKRQKKRRRVSFFWVVMNFTLNVAWLIFWISVCDEIIRDSRTTCYSTLNQEYSVLKRFAYTAVCFIAPAHAIYWIWMQWRCYRQWKYYKKYPTLEAEGEDAGNAEIDNK